jgi:hypothetical protein
MSKLGWSVCIGFEFIVLCIAIGSALYVDTFRYRKFEDFEIISYKMDNILEENGDLYCSAIYFLKGKANSMFGDHKFDNLTVYLSDPDTYKNTYQYDLRSWDNVDWCEAHEYNYVQKCYTDENNKLICTFPDKLYSYHGEYHEIVFPLFAPADIEDGILKEH